MKRVMIVGVFMGLASALAAGCGDDDRGAGQCEQASDILEACDMQRLEGECSGDTQRIAECTVKHPEGACDEESPDNDPFYSCLFGT